MQNFRVARLDGFALFVTGLCLVLGVGCAVSDSGLDAVIILFVGLFAYLLKPRGYRINGERLEILWAPLHAGIDLRQLVYVKRRPSADLGFRLFGIGGLFGYMGFFRASGPAHTWLTRTGDVVELAERRGRTLRIWLLSPRRPRAFVRAVRSAVGAKVVPALTREDRAFLASRTL